MTVNAKKYWNFDDMFMGSGANPSHNSKAGSYIVDLIAEKGVLSDKKITIKVID
ncbi:hypothetical protein [Niabella hibiscisoli]|uniref:hypothetical protein n=1 Tax=Niabella hibiscisoli TaxID=1825928 RepID=UPI001F0E34AA|nr:hypothetical protein [Niabella hibiscisoli]MCH5720410.1 hypothetical protein [Niabella hibiscisoli]